MNRREFLQFLTAGYMAGLVKPLHGSTRVNYNIKPFGNLRLIHLTDTHAQLDPMYFREPNYNLGVGKNKNMPPHLVGKKLLDYYSINSDLIKYAYTHLNFNEHAKVFGKFGGYAYLKTIVDILKDAANNNSLLLDGGDTWQGSGLSLLENGKDMVEASNILGVDVMTGHWEFTYGEKIFLDNLRNFNGDFVAQNISLTSMAISMFLIVTVPVILGMIFRRFASNAAIKFEPIAKKISIGLFIIVLLGAIFAEKDNIVSYFADAGLITLALNVIMMIVAFYVAQLLATGNAQKKCIAIECGLQNGTLAIFVGTTLFGGGAFVIPAATYSLIMFATSLIFVYLVKNN